MTELDDYKAAEAAEWGTWVAKAPIYFDGVLAYLPGHQVPASNVQRYAYDKQNLVERTSTPAKKD